MRPRGGDGWKFTVGSRPEQVTEKPWELRFRRIPWNGAGPEGSERVGEEQRREDHSCLPGRSASSPAAGRGTRSWTPQPRPQGKDRGVGAKLEA